MRIVLGTNALLISLPTKSPYRPIFDHLVSGTYSFIVSNDILSEYVDVVERKANSFVAANLAEALLNLTNLIKVDIYYAWNLIKIDPRR